MNLIPQNFREDRLFLLSILKWTLLGLLIRLLIMPFSMAAGDFIWNHYVPHQLITQGVRDPYAFTRTNFADKVIPTNNPYYPPLAFYMLAFFQFLFLKLMPTLKDWFFHFETWMKLGGGSTVGHMTLEGTSQLFRNIFILKLPLLFFDFGIGYLLIRLVEDKKKSLFVYKCWMLNPVVFYTVSAYGGIDIYPVFFMVLALFLGRKGHANWACVALSLGTAIKTFPLILMPLVIIFFGKTFKERLKILTFGISPLVLLYLPTYLSSGNYALNSLIMVGGTIGSSSATPILKFMKFIFLIGYIYILIHAHREGRKNTPQFTLENYFLLTLLLVFAFQPLGMRHFLWVTPFLILQLSRYKGLWRPILIQLVTLAELRMDSAVLWLGLFAPLNPVFFSSLPFLNSFIAPFIPVIFIHRISYRIFILATLYLIYRIWKGISAGPDWIFNRRYKKIILIIVAFIFVSTAIKDTRFLNKTISPKTFFAFDDLGILDRAPDNYIKLYGKHTLGQEFVPGFSNLFRIGIFIFKDKENTGDLIFHLKYSTDSKEDLVKIKVKNSDLHNNYYPFMFPPIDTKDKGSFYFFEFEPMTYSAKRPFYFYLESADSAESNSLKIGYWKNRFRRGYVGGSTYVDGIALKDGYLVFQTYCSWDGKLAEVFKQMGVRLMQDPNFIAIHFFLCLVLLTGIIKTNHKLRLAR